MKYDFKTITPRYGTGSAKWNEIENTLGERPNDIIPFSVADMEFATPPEIVEGLKEFLDTSILGYANPTDEFKQTVVDWMKNRHGWNAKKEWIVSAHGLVDAFHEAVKVYTEEGEGVMLLTPVYYPMYHAIKSNNRVLVDCPLIEGDGKYMIDFEAFEEKAKEPNTKIFILCQPHNPGSRIWTKDELEKIAEICLENHVLVIDDEIHNDLIMPGFTHTMYPTISSEAEQNCLVLTAPSKTFNLAGLQTSSVFIPNEKLREKMIAYNKTTNPNHKCNILGYRACEIAYKKCEPWLEECISVIDHNRKIITEFFNEHFKQIKVFDLQASYLLWMDWRGLGIDYKELERINHHEARVFFDEGYVFGEQGQGFERWNIACPTEEVEKALDRLRKAYDKYIK